MKKCSFSRYELLSNGVTVYANGTFDSPSDSKPHNDERHNLYCSLNIIRMIKPRSMRWTGHAARMEEKRNAYRILVGKPERKRPLGRPRRRWVNNIKLDFREIGWGDMCSIDLALDRDR
jgi:hypothetical protein